jgi:hypothetical protein
MCCCHCCEDAVCARRACFDVGSLACWRVLRRVFYGMICVILALEVLAIVLMVSTRAGAAGIAVLVIFLASFVAFYSCYCFRGFFSTDHLQTAVDSGNVGTVDWMLRKGAAPHPLMLVRDVGVDIAGLLIAHIVASGADVKAAFCQPLICAVVRDDVAVVRLLLDAGADANRGEPIQPQVTPIFYANSRQMVQLLVLAGADVMANKGSQWMPLRIAANHGPTEALECMVEHAIASGYSFTPVLLHSIVVPERVPMLVRLGSDVDATDSIGGTAVHAAANRGNVALLRVLLACCASVNAQMPRAGVNATMLPIEMANNEEIAAFLVAAGSPRDTCRFELTDGAIADAAHQIARTRVELIRARAFQVCVALDALDLPALLMCTIIEFACAPFAACVPFHVKWALVVAVKHRKRQEWASARSSSASEECETSENQGDSWTIDVVGRSDDCGES